MNEPDISRLLILGSGPAGYTAGLYAARAMLSPVIIEGEQAGGQLSTTGDVENYPGFSQVIQGPWLMDQMRAQAETFGVRMVADDIRSVDLSRRPFRLEGKRRGYLAEALIICTGAQAQWTRVAGEDDFRGFGVSSCATCDGFFYRDRKVVVVGGGNTAVEEALLLSNIASEVVLVHRRGELKAERILQERLAKAANVEIRWHTVLDEVLGENKPRNVSGVRLRSLESGAVEEMPVDGVFIAIGHKPSTGMFADQLALTPAGYIDVRKGSTYTTVPGVFAAGDVTDEHYRQAVTAAGMGCMAALDAERWLGSNAP